MEKLILNAVVILGLTFSYNALSYQSQTTCADASTCKTTLGPRGGLGAFIPGPSPGYAGGFSVGPSPEVQAAIDKKIGEDKAAYCKANNYPTHVPFCAGYKQQAIESCEKAVTEWYRLEVIDARDSMSATRRGCLYTYASPELLAAQTVCLDQAVGHYNGAVDKSKQDRLIRNENCSKYP